jgi:hypothetical protein
MHALMLAVVSASVMNLAPSEVVAVVDGVPIYYAQIKCHDAAADFASCRPAELAALRARMSRLLIDSAGRRTGTVVSTTEVRAATKPLDGAAINRHYEALARALLISRTSGADAETRALLRSEQISEAEFESFGRMMTSDTLLRAFLAQDHARAAADNIRVATERRLLRQKLDSLVQARARNSGMTTSAAAECFWADAIEQAHVWMRTEFNQDLKGIVP